MILIAESKNKKKSKLSNTYSYDITVSESIIDSIKKMDNIAFKEAFKLSNKKVELEYERYLNPKFIGSALTSFDGLVFKQLDLDFNDSEIDFLNENLRVITALNGIIKPFDDIYDIRLDFNAKTAINLKKIHNINLGTVINLASKEYINAVTAEKIINITFLEENLKAKATLSKIARGKMLNYLIKNCSASLETIKKFNENGYLYSNNLSDDVNIVFVKTN